jgi:hypothetical protein
MRPAVSFKHAFVESAPERLEDGVIYVSIRYRSVIHKCACGCGSEVVTPLGPTDWGLIFDGISISLDPSVGNWSLPCRSHYWIKRNKALWAGDWSDEQVARGRAMDRARKEDYHGERVTVPPSAMPSPPVTVPASTFSTRIGRWFARFWPGS